MVSLCGRGFDSLQLHPISKKAADFQLLFLFLSHNGLQKNWSWLLYADPFCDINNLLSYQFNTQLALEYFPIISASLMT